MCVGCSAYSITNNLDGGSALPSNDSTLNLTCSEDFYEENLTCVPQCNTWSEKTPFIETTTITVAGIASGLGTICGVIGIIGSIIQYKSMWELMGYFLHNHTPALYTYRIYYLEWLVVRVLTTFVQSSFENVSFSVSESLHAKTESVVVTRGVDE